ncbi:MAG: hypothetical protein KU38_02315 [Sulfurovum sp. FS08-3]|nr:MAG: hypothetical protein KU38_02315 [Sulfurovum sp. FS08-3]
MMTKYLLKERNDKSTKTLHIYEGIDDMKVICGSDSLTSVEFKDYLKTRSLEDMRIHIAKIAHTTNICSICISHLYKNENKKKPIWHLYECHKGELCLDQENLNSRICKHGSTIEYSKAPNIQEIRQECAKEANNRVHVCGMCVSRIYKNSKNIETPQTTPKLPPKYRLTIEGQERQIEKIMEFAKPLLLDKLEIEEIDAKK